LYFVDTKLKTRYFVEIKNIFKLLIIYQNLSAIVVVLSQFTIYRRDFFNKVINMIIYRLLLFSLYVILMRPM